MLVLSWTEFLGALAGSLILTGLSVPILRRIQLLDIPNHRSSHDAPVPRGGGIAVVLTVCAAAVISAPLNPELWVLLGAVLLLAGVGLVDDFRSVSTSLRLLCQFFVSLFLAAVFIAAGVVSWWWLPALAIAVIGYVNAFNFMDGVNGISSLTAAVIGGWWTWAGAKLDHQLLHVLGLLLAGAALGFLPSNAPKARVFLGDIGSYGLGVLIVGLSTLALTAGLPPHWAAAPLVVYGADTGWVLIKRLRAGSPLGEAHRDHTYQRLVVNGWSHIASAGTCAAAGAAVCAVVGIAGTGLTWWLVAMVALITVSYLALPALQSGDRGEGTR